MNFNAKKGGLLGLCVGASLMTFLELFDLILTSLYISCHQKHVKKVQEEPVKTAENEDETKNKSRDFQLEFCIKKIECLDRELKHSHNEIKTLKMDFYLLKNPVQV